MAKDLEDYLNEASYDYFSAGYKPSQFALEFITFIKLVNGGEGEENASPVMHYDMLDQLLTTRQNLFVSFRGSAKALDVDTLLMTPNGFVRMGDIKVGDRVIDRDGKATAVTVVSDSFYNQTYKITLTDGSSFIANEDHLHIVQRRTSLGTGVKGQRENKWIENVLTTKDIIAKEVVTPRNKVTKKNPKARDYRWFIPLVNNPVEFESVGSPIDPYTVGVILGGGSVDKLAGTPSVTSHIADVEELKSYIPYEVSDNYLDKRRHTTAVFRIRGIGTLVRQFIGTNTTWTKYIPNELLFGSVEERVEVLRGLMDTDGTITPKGSASFTSTSYELAQGVVHIVKSLGGNARIRRHENNYAGYYNIQISLPKINPFKLRRKAKNWVMDKQYKSGCRVAIDSIEPTEQVLESKCITVDSPTQSYLIEDSIVTHNTSILHEYLILFLATYGRVPGFGEVDVGMYISDTMDNGVKSMRTNLEFRWNNSEFLQIYVPVTKFTDVRWEFQNLEGKKLCFRGFGASPLALDEVVHTEKGTVTMKDIAIGDRVYGSDGVLANVVKKSDIFHKDMYRITLKDGRSLKVSHDHLNSVYVKVNHKFIKKVITTEEILRKSLKFSGKNEYRYAIPMCSPIEYPTKKLEVDPYTLGLMLSEGCITYDKFIPEEYKTASVHQRLELVKGLMDTDGTIYGNSRMSFTNTSKQLVDDLKGIIESLGGYTSLKVNTRCRKSYTLNVFITINVFKVPRKASKFKINNLYNKLAITDITKIEQVPSQCIGLDNTDHEFVSTNYFVTHNTGVRGFKEYGKRPTWVGFDDLLSDKNAESDTITEDIKKIVYKAARQALSPRKRMQIWTGTPFNKSDPLYEATIGNAWNVRTYPICEKFPCSEEEFRGAWEDRFDYQFVKNEYESLLESGEIGAFNQELMLRITSNEDRLVQDHDIVWCKRKLVWENRQSYNFYITTDLATSNQGKSDFSVIGVWAYSSNKDWILVDGVCKRQLMDKSIDDLFRLVSMYKPLSVGIEINGQQGGFIQWIKEQMLTRKIFFNLAGKNGVEGIRRTRKKIEYFKTFLPVIKMKKLWICEEFRDSELVVELLDEFKFVTVEKFKSRNDDAADMVTMLQEIDAFAPSDNVEVEYIDSEDGTFAFSSDDDNADVYKNSLVF